MIQQAEPGADSFVHLHVHSEFSLLDVLSHIGETTKRVADQGMSAIALTDHGSMYGVIPFAAAGRRARCQVCLDGRVILAVSLNPPGELRWLDAEP